jgi:hypothetical protein
LELERGREVERLECGLEEVKIEKGELADEGYARLVAVDEPV